MTDIKTPSPSDAEIAKLYEDETGFDIDDSPVALYGFARAVLAKWGTPPAVAGGAIAEVVMAVRPPKASPAWLPHKIIHASLQWLDSVPVGTKLYTTPQPTQAQAGAVPLTEEQIDALSCRGGPVR